MTQAKSWVRDLRKVLAHIDDPAYLAESPLLKSICLRTRSVGDSSQFDPCHVLRVAIDSLSPDATRGPTVLTPRCYDVLYRYAIAKQSIVSIATHLAISERQTYRELNRAINALANVLATRVPGMEQERRVWEVDATFTEHVRSEVGRLSESGEMIEDLTKLLSGVITDVQRLAEPRGITIAMIVGVESTLVNVNRVMLRQALINLLSSMFSVCSGDEVTVHLDTEHGCANLRFIINHLAQRDFAFPGNTYSLAAELFAAQGISWVHRDRDARTTEVLISIPCVRESTVLLIDDNEDLLALFRRYLQHHPYRVFAARCCEDALQIVDHVHPDAIILDILMPHRDGWEILQALRDKDRDNRPRIIVCSIVDDPQIRTAMGADAYLSKPVSQWELLQTLGGVLASAV